MKPQYRLYSFVLVLATKTLLVHPQPPSLKRTFSRNNFADSADKRDANYNYRKAHTVALTDGELHRRRTQCRRLAPKTFSRAFKEILCRDGSLGKQPAECALGALSANVRVSVSETINFCTAEPISYESGRCFASIANGNADAQAICYNATNNLPAICAESLVLPRSVPESFRTELCGGNNGTLEAALCANAISSSPRRAEIWPHHALRLCADATSDAPITQCAANSYLRPFPIDLVADLCQGSKDAGPVECFRKAPSTLDDSDRARLCSGSSSIAPTTCANAIPLYRRRNMTPEQVVSLCKYAGLPPRFATDEGPARCVGGLPPSVPLDRALQLCDGWNGVESAKCFLESAPNLRNETLQHMLCHNVTDGTIGCLRETPHTLGRETKAAVCQGADTSMPAICASLLWMNKTCSAHEELALDETIRKLCGGPHHINSAQCFQQSFGTGLSIRQRATLCRRAANDDDARSVVECAEMGRKANIESDWIVQLCDRARHGVGPVSCALGAPMEFQSNDGWDLATLCRDAHDAGPAVCARELHGSSFSLHQRSTLCRTVSIGEGHPNHGMHFIPAVQCAKDVQYLGEDDAVELCSESSTLTPANCAKSVPSASLPNSVIARCKQITSTPVRVRVDNLEYNGDELLPLTNIRADLSILDQFGHVMESDSGTVVAAGLTSRTRSNSNVELKGQLVNASANGRVSFQDLSLTQSGNYTLHFTLVNSNETAEGAVFADGARVFPEPTLVKLRIGEGYLTIQDYARNQDTK